MLREWQGFQVVEEMRIKNGAPKFVFSSILNGWLVFLWFFLGMAKFTGRYFLGGPPEMACKCLKIWIFKRGESGRFPRFEEFKTISSVLLII
jgi:hypothetical protein